MWSAWSCEVSLVFVVAGVVMLVGMLLMSLKSDLEV